MRPKATHAERVLFGRLGAYTMLSRNDPFEITRAARKAFGTASGATSIPPKRSTQRSVRGVPTWPAKTYLTR